MFDREGFEQSKLRNARSQFDDENMRKLAMDFVIESDKHNYGYQWTWLGMPIIQLPPDIIATQEIIWQNKPDVIIETGIAWGGSIVFYASILQLLGKGRVIGVDVVLPEKNRQAIMKYDFSAERIELHQGSSTDSSIVEAIKSQIKPGEKVMVVLDSNHTHEHVLDELRIYGPLVSEGQYMVVADTVIEYLPPHKERLRDWGPGNNPLSALKQYLTETDRFEIDLDIDAKVLTSFTPSGYLKCLKG